MSKVLKTTIKWISRIILGFLGLLLLLLLLFYLFRGLITERAVTYINERQPGEVVIQKINLKPFLNFPNVSLRLREVQYLSPGYKEEGLDTIPVFQFNDIFLSMNVVQLVRGTYLISEVRLADGAVNYRVGQDSVSNLEKALGIFFGSESEVDTTAAEGAPVRLDLQRFEIQDLVINYDDQPANTSFSVLLNGLESGFSYYPDIVTAAVKLQSEILKARVKEVNIDKPRSVSFSSALHYDQQLQKIALNRSTLDLKEASFTLGGGVDLESRTLDLEFSAVNTGIDLLNFLLSGVLDLEAIEQVGDGSIRLEGNASGSYSKQFPLVTVDVMAEDMAFYVRSIDQSVTGIGFTGFLTNGSKKDLSAAEVHLNDFHVDFPSGSLDANIEVHNIQQPYADITLAGDADLSVINEIIRPEAVEDLRGSLRFEGNVIGSVDKKSGAFLDKAGLLKIGMSGVGFTLQGHQVEALQGELLVQEKWIGLSDMEMVIDSNHVRWEGAFSNLLPWLLEFDADPSAELQLSADTFYPGSILNDTTLPGPFRNLNLNLSLGIGGQELRNALQDKTIPPVELAIEDIAMVLPGYAPISEGRLTFRLDHDTAGISDMYARIGESGLAMDAALVHYNQLIKKDSAANLLLSFDLTADKLRATDLLTISDQFSILPSQFKEEEIHDLKFKGKVETTVYELLKDSVLPDFRFMSDELHWRLLEYPDAFNDILLDVERRDSLLVIHRFTGSIGESNLDVGASLANLFDSSRTISGNIKIRSELIDLDRLLGYSLLYIDENRISEEEIPGFEGSAQQRNTAGTGEQRNTAGAGEQGSTAGTGVTGGTKRPKKGNEMAALKQDPGKDTVALDPNSSESPDLSSIDFPDLVLELDVKELRYQDNILKNINGSLSTKPYKILYFDQFSVQAETGGSMLVDGQFNVSDPSLYMLSANFEIDTVNMSDFNLPIAIGDSVYSLEDNFNGILSADGLAEFFINPDFSINTDYSTAMFNVRLEDGRVKNFTPLRALAKYTGNKNLDNVKFGKLRNSFTLLNGAVQIPLMSIESTIGLILLEGEQYLDGDFLYLARLPVSLVRGTTWNLLTNPQNKKTGEDEVQEMRAQKFLVLTVVGKDGTEEVKVGDKRDQFR